MTPRQTLWVGIASTLIAAAVVSLAAYLGGWKLFFSACSWFFLGSTTVSNWLIVLLAVLAIGFVIVCGILIATAAATEPSEPDDLPDLPTQMPIDEIIWKWRISEYGSPQAICSFCPKCDAQIDPRIQGPRRIWGEQRCIYQCDNCPWKSKWFEVGPKEVKNRVLRIIQQELRSALRKEDTDTT